MTNLHIYNQYKGTKHACTPMDGGGRGRGRGGGAYLATWSVRDVHSTMVVLLVGRVRIILVNGYAGYAMKYRNIYAPYRNH